MKIFMAGGIGGNLKPAWTDVCKLMDKGMPFNEAVDKALKIFLAGGHINGKFQQVKDYAEIDKYRPYILESFYYADTDTERLIPYFGDFMLDSGAFTFMEHIGEKEINWNEYAERYAYFIKKNDVKNYIELDLDYIIGCKGARELRNFLEKETGRQAIPVWHPIRGKDEFLKMCEEYDYVALGGIVGKKWQGTEQYMPWFIKEAHKRKAKIHGLGFTKLTKLEQYHFDSVDSTAWTTGNRFGYLYFFNGKTMVKKDAPKGHKLADSRAVALHNYTEWIKFQKYADFHF